MAYGVTTDGFVDKPIEDILSEVETEQKAEIAADLDVSPSQPLGQLNGIFAAKVREIWEVLQAVYSSFDPDQASGDALTKLSSLTGTIRRAATKSTVTGTVTVLYTHTVPAGSVVSVDGNPNVRFVTLEDVTGVTNPVAAYPVAMECEVTGPVVANAGTLTEIETPATGWVSVTNALDATIGQDEETDAELRLRRVSELAITGKGTLDAIRAEVLAVSGVTACTVFENNTDVTNSDGIPPHAFEVVVSGGDDQDIVDAIFTAGGAGIRTYGTSSGTATDSNGDSHTIYFRRPTSITIHVEVECTVDTDEYPVDGDTQIKTAIAVWAQANLAGGDDVVTTQLYAQVFSVSGVLDVTTLEIGLSDPPTASTNIAIGSREIADIQTANIDVTST